MLFKRPWLFLLILLIAIFSQHVESNREDLDSQSRRGFFKDIENFFSKLFNPNKPTYKRITSSPKITKIFRKVTIKIDGKNLLQSAMDSKLILLRSNQSINFPTNGTEYERLNKSVIVGDVDIDIMLKDPSSKAHEDQQIKSRKLNFIEDNEYEVTEKNQRRNEKHLMIIVTNNKKVHEDVLDSESLYLGQNEGFVKDILRKNYGKACIKVVVRKCYETQLSVKDIACHKRYNCKASFKSTFLNEAKKSCIIEFDPTTKLIKKGKKVDKNSRVHKRHTEVYTNECLPQLDKLDPNRVPRRLKKLSGIKPILRGRSSRKCEKLLRRKCYKSCMYSLRQTCSKVKCSHLFKKIFRRESKRGCASHYLITDESSDSSDTDYSD